jgi:hypothetical protein
MKIQPPRQLYYTDILDTASNINCEVVTLMKNHKLTYDQAIELYKIAVDVSKLKAYIENGDFLDENFMGIGKAIEDIAFNTNAL